MNRLLSPPLPTPNFLLLLTILLLFVSPVYQADVDCSDAESDPATTCSVTITSPAGRRAGLAEEDVPWIFPLLPSILRGRSLGSERPRRDGVDLVRFQVRPSDGGSNTTTSALLTDGVCRYFAVLAEACAELEIFLEGRISRAVAAGKSLPVSFSLDRSVDLGK